MRCDKESLWAGGGGDLCRAHVRNIILRPVKSKGGEWKM